MYRFNANRPTLEKGRAAFTQLVCVYCTTGFVGTDMYSLEVVGAGEVVGELEAMLGHENADSYGITNSCNCDAGEDDCECEVSEDIEGNAYVWQLSRCGDFIGGSGNDGEVLETLAEHGGIVYRKDESGAVTCVDFNVDTLRRLVDLSIDEAGELKYLESMIADPMDTPPLFVYV